MTCNQINGTPQTAFRNLCVIRRWKSDGSANRMRVEAAIENVLANGRGRRTGKQIAESLMRGRRVETRHAVFTLEVGDAR